MSIKVLVVEDDALIRVMAADALTDAGFEVLEAADGEEAMSHCREDAPDVLFTDIRLPGALDGWDIAEKCREADPEMPVIYSTGYSPTHRRPVPGSRWFQKPYTPDQLIGVVRELARRPRA